MGMFCPWRVFEMNVFEIVTVLLLMGALNFVGSFAEPTTKTKAFETALLLVIVAIVTITICVVLRVSICIITRGGPKSLFSGYPRTVDNHTLEKCLITLGEMRFSDEIRKSLVENMTETDRRVLVQFVHSLQTLSIHTLEFPMAPGKRIFVPGTHIGDISARASFKSKLQNDISSSKLESYI